MQELVLHLVRPIVAHPDELSLQVIEGDAVVMLELVAHPDDRAVLEGEGGRTLRAIRSVLSAAAGKKKATLDLVEEHAPPGEEADDTEE